VSLRAGWWSRGSDAVTAARACSDRAGSLGAASYGYAVEYLGVRYLVSGAFAESGEGLVQLEGVAPLEAAGFVADLTRSWIEGNLRSLPRR